MFQDKAEWEVHQRKGDKYILQFEQIQFAVWTKTVTSWFGSFDRDTAEW